MRSEDTRIAVALRVAQAANREEMAAAAKLPAQILPKLLVVGVPGAAVGL